MTKQIRYSKRFTKHYAQRIKPHPKLDRALEHRVGLFLAGQRGHPLNDHKLTGHLRHQRAFSVTADIRVLYVEDDEAYVFTDIGTHAQVYNN